MIVNVLAVLSRIDFSIIPPLEVFIARIVSVAIRCYIDCRFHTLLGVNFNFRLGLIQLL
jgi:hypothetical protein